MILSRKQLQQGAALLVACLPIANAAAQTRPPTRAKNVKSAATPVAKPQAKTRASVKAAQTVQMVGRRADGRFRYGVKPNWIDGERFWYRHDSASGRREFVLVDLNAGTKAPAFDRARMARALSQTLGRTVTDDSLPVDSLGFDAATKALRIQVGGKAYLVDARDGSLSESEALLGRARRFKPAAGPRRSRGGGADTELTFVNRTGGEVRLFWLDTDGKPHQYGSLRPDEQRKQHTFAGHVWQAEAADGKPILAFVGGDIPGVAIIEATASSEEDYQSAPQTAPDSFLSPDGKWQVVPRDYNLFLKDVKTAKETALTTNGSKDDAFDTPPYWSPDSRRLVAFQTVPAEEHKVYLVESSPTDQVQPRLHVNEYPKPGDRVAHPRPRLFDIASAKQIPVAEDLFPNPYDIDYTGWEPDRQRFVFRYNQRGHQVVRVCAIDGATGNVQAVIEETSPTFIDYSQKGFLHLMPKTQEAIWASERSGWNHLYRYDTRTGQAVPITQGEWVVRGVDRVDEAKRQIWFRAAGIVPGQDPYYVHHCRVNFDGSHLTVLTEGDGTHTVEYGPDGKYLVDTYSRVDLPPTSTARCGEDGKQVLALETGTREAGVNVPERFAAKGRDSKTDIYGVIVRPSNFDPLKKYPVLENIYAGPQGAFVPKAWGGTDGMQALADLGFIVVQIDGMGTNWRSKAFHDVCWKNLADAGFADRIPWIKAAAETRPYMDVKRVGITS